MSTGGDPSNPPFRKKGFRLSTADKALWDAVASRVDRRISDHRAQKTTAAPASKPPGEAAHPPSKPRAAPAPPAKPKKVVSPPGAWEPPSTVHRAHPPLDRLAEAAHGLGRKKARALARGDADADATIDLHGMTKDRAHRALQHFLQIQHGRGAKIVCVVTGKGGGWKSGRRDPTEFGSAEEGVLKRAVRLWLREPPFDGYVAKVSPAPPRRGGAGALYVRLRASPTKRRS